jgi:hypothetical protein
MHPDNRFRWEYTIRKMKGQEKSLASLEAGRLGSREAGRLGGWEAGKPGSWEAGKPGGREAGRPGSREAGKPGSWESGKPGSDDAINHYNLASDYVNRRTQKGTKSLPFPAKAPPTSPRIPHPGIIASTPPSFLAF